MRSSYRTKADDDVISSRVLVRRRGRLDFKREAEMRSLLFRELDRYRNPFHLMIQHLDLFLGQVHYHANRADGSKAVMPFAGHGLKLARKEYAENYRSACDAITYEFARVGPLPDGLADLLSVLAFDDLHSTFRKVEDFHDLEEHLEKAQRQIETTWRRFAVQLEGHIHAVEEGALKETDRPPTYFAIVSKLYDPDHSAMVFGTKQSLSESEWQVVKVLSDFRAEGRTAHKSDLVGGRDDIEEDTALKTLTRLAKREPWNLVIRMAGVKNGGYELL